MEEKRPGLPEFTSKLRWHEYIAAIGYLPLHVWCIPAVLTAFVLSGKLSMPQANLLVYCIGVAYMLMFLLGFFRRDFDALCDRPFHCILEIFVCYGLMLAMNMVVSGIISAVTGVLENPNNSTIVDMAGMELGQVAAMTVFMAPLVEEPIFRAGIFGLFRSRSRVFAYIASSLLFSAYHVFAYVIADPANWIYIIQYIPVSMLMCRCYERTNSIWGPIFFHMLNNGIALYVLYSVM